MSNFRKHFRNIYSLSALLICILVIGYLVVFHLPINVFVYDVLGYYLYLPTIFGFKDSTMHNFDQLQSVLSEYHTSDGFYQAFKLDNRNWVIKYPMGLSILYLPFYLIGDAIAELFGFPADGFSKPYQLSVLFGCYIYTVIGLISIRKVLLYLFTDIVTALTMFFLVFGSNYFFHVSLHGQPAMPHNFKAYRNPYYISSIVL